MPRGQGDAEAGGAGVVQERCRSDADPCGVDCLRLKKGFVLRAYRQMVATTEKESYWAMPIDSEFPEPNRCPPGRFPKPSQAIDFGEAIEGDGSPWSYLCASLRCGS